MGEKNDGMGEKNVWREERAPARMGIRGRVASIVGGG